MERLKRVSVGVSFFLLIFVGTLYLYSINQAIALIFNLACFGVGAAYLAKEKNRSIVGWFLAGFFGGLIAFTVVLIVKPIEE